jgi:hypothetical protein
MNDTKVVIYRFLNPAAQMTRFVTHADYRALEEAKREAGAAVFFWNEKYRKAQEELAALRVRHEMVRQCCMDETVRATRLLGELKEIERNHSDLIVSFEELTAACEEEFGCDEIGSEGGYLFEDDETVSDPDTSITFGMIRRARKAITSHNLSLSEASKCAACDGVNTYDPSGGFCKECQGV